MKHNNVEDRSERRKIKRYNRKAYTVAFLKLANYPIDDDIVELYLRKFWVNQSIKNLKRLALSKEGARFLVNTLKAEHYVVSFKPAFPDSPNIVNYIESQMKRPYYYDNSMFITFNIHDHAAAMVLVSSFEFQGAMPAMKGDPVWEKTEFRQEFNKGGKIVLKHKF